MLLLTCPFGLSALLRTECKRLGIQSQDTFPNGCRIQDDTRTTIATLNLQSRLANKVYLECARGIVTSFEELFQLVSTIDRSQRISPKQGCSLHVTTHDSMLHAPRSIQSVAHKAIIQHLNGGSHTARTIDPNLPVVSIYIRIDNNLAYVMLNTSGDSLHQRGWRRTQGDAPCKEHLAVATILLARRPFQQPLRDPCCGSGTLLIEAARLAKNIAPGKERFFACEQYPQAAEVFAQQRATLSGQELNKSWTFIGSDIDPSMLEKAKQNAISAGVGDLITFIQHDLLAAKLPDMLDVSSGTTIIANPPYGKRLQQDTLGDVHDRLAELSRSPGRHGAILSGYPDADHYFPARSWKRKETRNGKDRVYIWTPKGAKPNKARR